MCDAGESIRLDQDIATRLQHEHPEQYITLVRMHLSFELDLNTDTENDPACMEKNKNKKWKGFHKKAKGCAAANSPEAAKTLLTNQNINDMKQLISFLKQPQNITQEGIFRKTGSLARQNELKNLFLQGSHVALDNGDYTAHDCASVLKSFLSDLSEPLLTELYYPAYCQVAELCHTKDSQNVREDRLLNTIQLLLLLLPPENNFLLRCIIELLHQTIQYEASNKMTAENLATLFTPHFICPRKLGPEALHTSAQQMCGIVAFMVRTGPKLFHIPPKLATDIRAYFMDMKRRKTMSPEHILNESVTSDSVANTVYTFVDREKTAEAHVMNSTDTALAQLYAHIQSLPESSKKRKLIKQFNRENGHGTPLQVLMLREKNSSGSASSVKGSKSISDSIKRHIFNRALMTKTPKLSGGNRTPLAYQTPNGTALHAPKQRVLFQSPLSSASNSPALQRSSSVSSASNASDGTATPQSAVKRSCSPDRSNSSSCSSHSRIESKRSVEFALEASGSEPMNVSTSGKKRCRPDLDDECVLRSVEGTGCPTSASIAVDMLEDEEPPPPEDDEDFVEQDDDDIGDEEVETDTDDRTTPCGAANDCVLSDNEGNSFKTIGLSDSRSKYRSEPNLSTMQHDDDETDGTGRTTKGSGKVPSTMRPRSGSGKQRMNINFFKSKLIKGVSMGNLRFPFTHDGRSSKKSSTSSLLKCCFDETLKATRRSTASLASPALRKQASASPPAAANRPSDKLAGYEEMQNENNANLDLNCWNVGYLTSTPALSGRNSMSPITKSTQRMPKSMQESIMTPRSRKPVVLLAGMNVDQQQSSMVSSASFSSLKEEDEEDAEGTTALLSSSQRESNLRKMLNDTGLPPVNSDSVFAVPFATAGSARPTVECSASTAGAGTHGSEQEESLTSTFRDYLLSRSVMTDSPADLSFSSQPDDYDSSTDIERITDSKLSSSMLYFLDGNEPESDNGDNDRAAALPSRQKTHSTASNSNAIPFAGSSDLDETSL